MGGWGVIFTLCILLLATCDLFNPTDRDMLAKIDAEIAWANAARLTVAVTYPPEWGSSNPQQGTITPVMDIRLGYEFNLEFSPLPDFGFERWLAFPTSVYNELVKTKSAAEVLIDSLNNNGVQIRETVSSTGARVATIKINTTEPVTLVPWCTDRPRISHSNPPLISSGFSFTRGQQITMTFSMPLIYDDKEEIEFGVNTITINGQGLNGIAWNKTGDLDFHDVYFDTPYYDKELQAIIIKPKQGSEPPELYNITVTVGTGIIGFNGEGFSAPVQFSYSTSKELVTLAYKASNIWASHDPEKDRRVESFFYQTAPSDRDRRLRPGENSYTVSLFFSVSRSMGEIYNPEPNALTIVPVRYADLDGTVINTELTNRSVNYKIDKTGNASVAGTYEDSGTFIPMDTNENSAGGVYQQMNKISHPLDVNYYEVIYTFTDTDDESTSIPSGIYRLVLLPYQADDDIESYKDVWTKAVEEGRYVTVVINKDPPNTDGTLSFSGFALIESEAYCYIPDSRFMTITPNFTSVQDNGKMGGILPSQATPNIPWTMVENRNLLWRWKTRCETISDSPWYFAGVTPPPFDLSILGPRDVQYDIIVQFSDGLDNFSDEKPMGKIMYTSTPAILPPREWSAVYNSNLNTLTINWTTPGTMTSASISGGPYPANIGGPGRKDYTFSSNSIPSSFQRYDITLTAIGPSGNDSVTFTIFNVAGGMTVDANKPAFEANITSPDFAGEALGITNRHKQWVLRDGINVTNWVPIGTAANSFHGTFYGNGRTIGINGFAEDLTHYGFFGCVNGATIRDLTVRYNTTINVTGTSDRYVGGIAAETAGTVTQITNSKVESSSANIQVHVPAGTDIYSGSIVGRNSSNPSISGCSGVGFSFTAFSDRQATFNNWLRSGTATSNTYPLVVTYGNSVNARVRAVMNIFVINNFTDNATSAETPGTLRHALANAINNDTIRIGTPNSTILLATPLQISSVTDLIIEGNGLTLTPAASWSSNTESQLFKITNSSASVTINRVHFKDGKANDSGGAIRNSGTLTLVSCIFSGNVASNDYAWGGAIYNMRTMTVIGCTFYNNRAGYGGAIYTLGVGELNLSGNLFYENRSRIADGRHIVHAYNSNYAMVTSNGYNIVDVPLDTQSGGSGFSYATGDITFATVLNSNLTSPFFSTTGATAYTLINITSMRRRIPSGTWVTTNNMPTTDFYGNTRAWPGPPGAVVQNAPAPTNPTNIFREDFEGTNSFTIVNGSAANQWHVGTATKFSGTRSAYISNDNGTSNAYTTEGAGGVVHMYRNVTFPVGTGPYTLTFNVRVEGEGETWYYDILRIFLVETSNTPAARVGSSNLAGNSLTGDLSTINFGLPNNTDTVLGTYNLLGPDWTTVNISIPASNAGTTKRLVFTWRNDEEGGKQPPAAVDNIELWY